ncbi:MAG: FAD-binding oxidoreductase [Nitrososphaerota archaeon]
MHEFAVVGMGITGLSSAIRLSEYGYNVVMLGDEKSASTACAGIITLQLEDLRDIILVKESIKIINELIRDSSLDEVGVTGRGFISVEDPIEAEESAELLKKAGVEFKQFNVGDALQIWPWLVLNKDEVVTLTIDDVSVEADKFIRFLIRKAVEKGVRIEKKWVKEIVYGERHRLVLSQSGEIQAEVVVLCLGAWTRVFLSKYGVSIPVAVLRIPAYRFRVSSRIISLADEVYESYWRPGVDGTIVGGGYHAEIVDDPLLFFQKPPDRFRVDAEKLLRLRLSSRAELVEEWSGPISITPDLDPIIDNLPGYDNVFFIDGLRGYGLMRGVALGYLLADIVSQRRGLDSIEEYRLSRFSNIF